MDFGFIGFLCLDMLMVISSTRVICKVKNIFIYLPYNVVPLYLPCVTDPSILAWRNPGATKVDDYVVEWQYLRSLKVYGTVLSTI